MLTDDERARQVAEFRRHAATIRRMNRNLVIGAKLPPTPRRLAGQARTRGALEGHRLNLVGLERFLQHHGHVDLAGLLWREHSYVQGLSKTKDPNEQRKWRLRLDQVRVTIRAEILGTENA